MQIDYPFHFDRRGRTAETNRIDHIVDMIYQFLFTVPGERVNRPDFGAGILQLVFAPSSPEVAAALQFTVRSGLERWLGDIIDIEQLEAFADAPRLTVTVAYGVRNFPEPQVRTFEGTTLP